MHLAVFQNLRGDFELPRERFQHLRVCRIAALRLFAARQAHFFKQQLAKLLGRIDVEGFPRQLVDPRGQFRKLRAVLLAQASQLLPIHQEARMLHIVEHRAQRHFDAGKHAKSV